MRLSEQEFTLRQYMINPDFDFYHYIDESLMEVEYHNHDFYEIYFFISGRVTYIIEGKSYILKPGDIVIINNKDLHKPVIEPGVRYERIVICLNPGFINKLETGGTNLSMCFESASRSKYNLLRPSPEVTENLMCIITKLEKAYTNISYGSNLLKNIYFTELIVFLNKAYADSSDEEIKNDINYNEKINKIVQYINENLKNDLSLELLSAKFYLSKYYLLREFKKNVGYTIHSYIQQKRLIMAKILLRGNVSITEVCLRCGFGDYSNFIRSFKKAFGLSPRKYTKKHLQDSMQINKF